MIYGSGFNLFPGAKLNGHYVCKYLNIKFQNGERSKVGHNGVYPTEVLDILMRHLDEVQRVSRQSEKLIKAFNYLSGAIVILREVYGENTKIQSNGCGRKKVEG